MGSIPGASMDGPDGPSVYGEGPWPGAERTCRPASPHNSTMRSLKPLTTAAFWHRPSIRLIASKLTQPIASCHRRDTVPLSANHWRKANDT
jgi:hypothetical protein